MFLGLIEILNTCISEKGWELYKNIISFIQHFQSQEFEKNFIQLHFAVQMLQGIYGKFESMKSMVPYKAHLKIGTTELKQINLVWKFGK